MSQPKPFTSATLAPADVTVELQGPDDTAAIRFNASSDQTVLCSATNAGHELPSSCRNGSCRACISRLHSGQIAYRIDWPGLLAEEKAVGLFLPCVAYPLTDLVLTVGAGDS